MQNSTRRNVVVTGANKGIGFGIIEGLFAGNIPYDLILTSRNTQLGEEAVNTLKKKYNNPVSTLTHHQLDINDDKSIDNFVDWLKKTSGKLDVLVNNAAYAKLETTDEEKRETINTNFFNTIKLTEKLHPLLTKEAKVVFVSSAAGILSFQGPTIKKALEDEKLTEQQLFDIGKNILNYLHDYPHLFGPIDEAYPASKALLNTYIRRLFVKKLKDSQQVYSVHPGFVATDLSKPLRDTMTEQVKAIAGEPLSIEEGADTSVYLINLPFEKNDELNGQFFYQRKLYDYDNFKP